MSFLQQCGVLILQISIMHVEYVGFEKITEHAYLHSLSVRIPQRKTEAISSTFCILLTSVESANRLFRATHFRSWIHPWAVLSVISNFYHKVESTYVRKHSHFSDAFFFALSFMHFEYV